MSPRVNTSGLLVIGLWCCCVLFLCGTTIADPDLWGHTLYGLRAIERGVLLETTDPFTYTAPGAAWINHEWLTEYQFGWLWRLAGGLGLVLWRNVLIIVLFGVAAAALRHARTSLAAAALLMVLNTEVLADFVVFVRPQLATYALFAIHLFLLRIWWDRETRLVWLLPPLMGLWANLHGGFLAGAGVLIVFVAAAGWRGVRQPTHRKAAVQIGLVALVSALATFANPYGWNLHAMLWDHLATEQFVREWQPVWSTGLAPVLTIPFLITFVVLGTSRRWQWVDVAVLAIVSWQAAWHLRHVALLSIATLVLLPAATTDALGRLFPRLTSIWSTPDRHKRRISAVAAVCLFLLGLSARGASDLWSQGIAPWEIAVQCQGQVPGMPVRAVEFLRTNDLRGNLLTDYGWAQFVLWHRFPENRVGFDGRYRTVFSAELEADFLAWQRAHDPQASFKLLDEYDTEIALVPTDSRPADYLTRRPDWVCLLRDDQAAVFVKRLPKFANRIAAAGARNVPEIGTWAAFPGLTALGTTVASPDGPGRGNLLASGL